MRRTAVLVLAGIGLAAAPAHATLVYDTGVAKPHVWSAADDGSGKRLLASGSNPKLSPDGTQVAYYVQTHTRSLRPDLVLIPSNGGAAPRRLAKGWRDVTTFAWSPDSKSIVTVIGPELGTKKLVLIDVATGAARTIATGFFTGVSFSPAGDSLIYGRSRVDFQFRSDIYRVATAGGSPVKITSDRKSEFPLWGPQNQIVFVKLIDAKKRKYGPKSELYLMAPDGTAVKRLTHTKVGQLLTGLFPTAWSADGKRLLAEFEGQDTSYAVTVNPLTGSQRPVTRARESGFVGTALSADGTTILGATGGFDPGSRHNVAMIPYGGGKATVLARKAFDPGWNR
jgi:Tol biopolymer transport system component